MRDSNKKYISKTIFYVISDTSLNTKPLQPFLMHFLPSLLCFNHYNTNVRNIIFKCHKLCVDMLIKVIYKQCTILTKNNFSHTISFSLLSLKSFTIKIQNTLSKCHTLWVNMLITIKYKNAQF